MFQGPPNPGFMQEKVRKGILSYVNPSKAWNAKLEADSFLPSKKPPVTQRLFSLVIRLAAKALFAVIVANNFEEYLSRIKHSFELVSPENCFNPPQISMAFTSKRKQIGFC